MKLSHGLPALVTNGNRIVRRGSGEQVLLRGVNRSALEYSEPAGGDFLRGAGVTGDEIRHITRDWRANIVRIPFNQDWVLNGRAGLAPEDYLQAIDQIIDWAAASGAYTLLDLQWLSKEKIFGTLEDGSPNRIAPLPDDLSPAAWRVLAKRYRDEPAVLFDLYNEPHDTSPDLWRFWAGLLLGTIREECPESLIFVAGIDWAYDLRDCQLSEGNVVYSSHIYPWKTLRWKKAFGFLADDLPVFAGEWGGEDAHLEWGDELADYLEKLGMGWTAWSWSDWPRLVKQGNDGWTATRFGELVKRRLSGAPMAS